MQAYYQQQQQQRQQPFGGGGGLGGVGGGNTGAGSLAPGSAGSLRCAPCASLRLGAARDLTPLFFLHYCNVFFSVCPFSSSNRPSRLVAVSSFPRCLDLLCPPPAPYQQRRRLQQEQALVAVRGPVTLAVLAALWEAVAARHSPPAIVRFCIQPRLALDKKEAAQTIDLFSLSFLGYEKEKVFQLVQELISPETREEALLELSKKREAVPELAIIMWHSFGIERRSGGLKLMP